MTRFRAFALGLAGMGFIGLGAGVKALGRELKVSAIAIGSVMIVLGILGYLATRPVPETKYELDLQIQALDKLLDPLEEMKSSQLDPETRHKRDAMRFTRKQLERRRERARVKPVSELLKERVALAETEKRKA